MSGASLGLIFWEGGKEGTAAKKLWGQLHLFNGVAAGMPGASIKEIAGNVIECNGLGSKLVEML